MRRHGRHRPQRLKTAAAGDDTAPVDPVDRRPFPRRLWPVGVVSWLLFGLAWWRVVDLHAQVRGIVLVEVLAWALLVLGINVWWVGHNRRIYRRKGPRRGVPVRGRDYTVDRLGRPVRLLPSTVRPQEVVLSLTSDGTKVYRPAGTWSPR